MYFFKKICRVIPFSFWCLYFLYSQTVYWAEKIVKRIIGFDKKTEFVRKGNCQNSGQCCQAIGIEIPTSWLEKKWMVRLIQIYFEITHRFKPIEISDSGMLGFECEWLGQDNKCQIYPFRPKVCRDFPFVMWRGSTKLHKGCGFWFVRRIHVGTFEEHIKQKQHLKERKEYLDEFGV